jgi:hypothetical protein
MPPMLLMKYNVRGAFGTYMYHNPSYMYTTLKIHILAHKNIMQELKKILYSKVEVPRHELEETEEEENTQFEVDLVCYAMKSFCIIYRFSWHFKDFF